MIQTTASQPDLGGAAMSPQEFGNARLSMRQAVLAALLASAGFHVAFYFSSLNFLILLHAFGLILLSSVRSGRWAFRLGFLTGLSIFAVHLAWFWRIFGPPALCLFAVLSVFYGAFVGSLHAWREKFGDRFLWIGAPVLWVAFEYFRGELYPLKFSWLSLGYVFSGHSGIFPAGGLGVYGCGFLLMMVAGAAASLRRRKRGVVLFVSLGILGLLLNAKPGAPRPTEPKAPLHVAGIQLEFPPALAVPAHLDEVLQKFPETELIVLSEYTFDADVPPQVRAWCQAHGKYLVAGGRDDSAGSGEYYNTAFVIGPDGEVVFKQAKSVPIQFFKDGLPAQEQNVWQSPWGPIAICVCYDLSYRRIVDRFMRRGAGALIVPFMDVTDWGADQHRLHARVTSLRAQEYQVPIFRLGSSGISQWVDRTGRVRATAPFPGQESIMGGTLELAGPARLPVDTWLAPACTGATALFLGWLFWTWAVSKRAIPPKPLRSEPRSARP